MVDNGKGMSKDDLENKWLFLAYSDKKEGELHPSLEINESEDPLRILKNRTYVGSKGIGRFSSDRLGAIIKIRTKVANENIEHQLTANWDDFELSLENIFENIDVKYESTDILSRKDSNSYTILEISNLREFWGKDEIDKVINKLSRLKNPFVDEDDLLIYCGVNIFENGNYK
ncbi:ATP-binding protein [Pasteurella multocida]|uniref:ATP-binding protein n=1 Tax=Pasteurella multocida TaxID=747 RepID=UPI002100168F|nr:ATP-binding protein [Pasteurella multocida]